MTRLTEGAQVRSDLDEEGAGAAEIDARNRLQQPQGALVLGQFSPDALVQRGEGGVGPVEGLHLHLQLEQRERVERGGQRLGQRRQLGLHVARQAGQDAARRVPGNQPVEDAPPILEPLVETLGRRPVGDRQHDGQREMDRPRTAAAPRRSRRRGPASTVSVRGEHGGVRSAAVCVAAAGRRRAGVRRARGVRPGSARPRVTPTTAHPARTGIDPTRLERSGPLPLHTRASGVGPCSTA